MKRKKPASDSQTANAGSPELKERSSAGSADDSSRRFFLSRLGLSATLVAVAGQAYAFLRSLVPNVRYEQPQRFKVGSPSQFSEGAKFFKEERVFVFRERDTFFAISAICTHLGCTVKMERLNKPKKVSARGRAFEEQVELHCLCHG